MISIITPVWNKQDITNQFLMNNWRFLSGRNDVEWIIVNNGSTDNTDAVLDIWKPRMRDRLKIITLTENTGFGPGHNRGAKEARGDILIHISNDVTPYNDYVSPIENKLKNVPDALVGAELLAMNTGWNYFVNSDGTKVLVPYLTGWCVACNKATWEKLGGFDERYVPCDYEDMDLSYTATEMGIPLVPISLPLRHASGESAKLLPGGRLQITYVNQRRFLDKWNLELVKS